MLRLILVHQAIRGHYQQKAPIVTILGKNRRCSGWFVPPMATRGKNEPIPHLKTEFDKRRKGEIYALREVFSNTVI